MPCKALKRALKYVSEGLLKTQIEDVAQNLESSFEELSGNPLMLWGNPMVLHDRKAGRVSLGVPGRLM